MKIDKELVKGVAYYIGDGRSSTPRSLSTVNQNIETMKFFIKWLRKYFDIPLNRMKIRIKMNTSNFYEEDIKKEFSRKLRIKKKLIASVSMKEKAKEHHKILIEIWAHNSKAKRTYDKLIPIIKGKCLKNKKLAIEYIKGIMAAEGSPKYDVKSGSRKVHLKMKNESEIKYIGKLLNQIIGIRSSILKVRTEEGMWLITISGFYELNKLNDLDIFEIESEKKEKFRRIVKSYKRAQVKKGDVTRFYIEKLNFYNKKYDKRFTAPELAKIIGRDRTRTINVLRQLEKKGLIKSKRKKSTGRAFEFWTKN